MSSTFPDEKWKDLIENKYCQMLVASMRLNSPLGNISFLDIPISQFHPSGAEAPPGRRQETEKNPDNPVNPVKKCSDRINRMNRKRLLPFLTKGRRVLPAAKSISHDCSCNLREEKLARQESPLTG